MSIIVIEISKLLIYMIKKKYIFLVVIGSMILFSCDGDQRKKDSSEGNVEKTEIQTEKGHHDGHDHDHGHEGHDHDHGADMKREAEKRASDQASLTSKTGAGNTQKTMQGYVDKQGLLVPNACSFLETSWVASVLGVSNDQISIKDGSNPNMKNSRSCFFRWEDSSLGNAGVMVQVMTNPVPDDFAEWVSHFLTSKKTTGEQDFTSTNQLYKYKDWNVLGDEGAYCQEIGKYHWRLGDKYLFLVAFNLDVSEKKMNAYAEKIGKKVMESFNEQVQL